MTPPPSSDEGPPLRGFREGEALHALQSAVWEVSRVSSGGLFLFAGSAPLCGASLSATQPMSATEWRAPSNEPAGGRRSGRAWSRM